MLIDYTKLDRDCVFIDLRTPLEYADGTIGAAVNVPIFTNDERAKIGTAYKKDSVEKAKEMAIDAVAVKLPEIYRRVIEIYENNSQVALFCARGGMRSQTLGSLLNAMGYRVNVVMDGYKGYRNAIIAETERLNAEKSYIVIHGNTGVGKTKILKGIEALGGDVLDIEALSRHRGSLLGKVGISEPVTQKQFEHELYEALRDMKGNDVFVEAESRRLGSILVPQVVIDRMRDHGCHVNLTADLDFRAKNIIEDYITCPEDVEEIAGLIPKFVRTLGNTVVSELSDMLEKGEYEEIAKYLMVNYYDPKYEYRKYQMAEEFRVTDVDTAAHDIYKWYAKERFKGNGNKTL